METNFSWPFKLPNVKSCSEAGQIVRKKIIYGRMLFTFVWGYLCLSWLSALHEKFCKQISTGKFYLKHFFSQIFLAYRFDNLILKSKLLALLDSVVYVWEPQGWLCIMLLLKFILYKSSHHLQYQKQLIKSYQQCMKTNWEINPCRNREPPAWQWSWSGSIHLQAISL